MGRNWEIKSNKPIIQQKKKRNERVYKYYTDKTTLELTEKEAWSVIVYNIMTKAPVFTPIINLPRKNTDATRLVTFDGKEFSTNERFFRYPLQDMLYMVYFEIVQVVLGFRTEKTVEFSKENQGLSDIVTRLRKELIKLQIGHVEDVVTHCLLLYNSHMIGIEPDSIKPTDAMKNGIYKLFGSCNLRNSEKYIDNYSLLSNFMRYWSKYDVNECYETVARGDKNAFDIKVGNYKSDILYKINCTNSSNLPMVIDIPIENIRKMRRKLAEKDEESKKKAYEEMIKEYLDKSNDTEDNQDNNEIQQNSNKQLNNHSIGTSKCDNQNQFNNGKPEQQTDRYDDNQVSQQTKNTQLQQDEGVEVEDDFDTELDAEDVEAVMFDGYNKQDFNEITDDMIYDMYQEIEKYPPEVQDTIRDAMLPSEEEFFTNYLKNDENIGEKLEDWEVIKDILPDVDEDFIDSILKHLGDDEIEKYENERDRMFDRSDSAKKRLNEMLNSMLQSSQEDIYNQNRTITSESIQSSDQIDQENAGIDSNNNYESIIQNCSFNSEGLTQEQVNAFTDQIYDINVDMLDEVYNQMEDDSSVFDKNELEKLLNKMMNDELSDELTQALKEALDKDQSMKDRCNNYFEDELEVDSVLDEDVFGSMDEEKYDLNMRNNEINEQVYKDLIISVEQFVKSDPKYTEECMFAERLTPIFEDVYKVSSVWWKKAQKMILGYVPNINSSYRRPNKKYVTLGYILPSKCDTSEDSEVDRLRVFLDSSGSMSEDDFLIFKSIIKSTQKFFPNETQAFEFNNNITEMKCTRGKIIGMPQSIGGTDISCVLEHISNEPFKSKTLNIVVTDGGFNWNKLIRYMSEKDKQSKFMFILTRGKSDNAEEAKKTVNPKRLSIISIENVDNNIKSLKWG